MEQSTEARQILELLRDPAQKERGFRLLMQTYKERLYYYLMQMLKEHHAADEVLQTTFIKTFRGLEGFRGEAQLSTWLFRIAINEAKTYMSKQQRRRTESLELLDFGQSQPRAEVYLDEADAERCLQEAIALLPEKQRQVFLLRYYEEMPYQEIAQLTGTSEGALKASYHHAVKKIEAYIQIYTHHEGTSE